MSSIPGIRAKHAIITPVCRENRTAGGAFDEAVRRLRDEYEACLPHNAASNFHLVLTVEQVGSGTQASPEHSGERTGAQREKHTPEIGESVLQVSPQEQEKEHSAALLPVDPSAAVTTEPLPNSDARTAEIMDAFAELRCAMNHEQESACISRVIAAVRADERAKYAWEDISSAPKDGSVILLAEYRHGGYSAIEHGAWEFIETSEWDGVRCYGWCTDMGRIEDPTHWMPKLPDPEIGSGNPPVSEASSPAGRSEAQE